MQYMLLIYGDEKVCESMSADGLKQLMAGFQAYSAALAQAGVLRGGAELAPVHSATTLRARGGTTVCTDGPFAATLEQLGGYYLIEAPDLDAALGWAAQCPAAAIGAVEVRPLV